MELEEAIKDVKRICEYLKESDYISIDKDTKISLETLLNHITKQEKMAEILLDLYWNKEQVRLIIDYGIESKGQLRKEIEKKAEEGE